MELVFCERVLPGFRRSWHRRSTGGFAAGRSMALKEDSFMYYRGLNNNKNSIFGAQYTLSGWLSKLGSLFGSLYIIRHLLFRVPK